MLDQLIQNSYVDMTILRYCSKCAINIIRIEVAVNYVVYCSAVTQTTIGRVTTQHYRVHTTEQNTLANYTINN